ncbi:hypothetical protein PInf_013771 [Phytophthora infestans]|nr:hypothetical protein PInf_013771 [Phytophthora infestans]
MVQTIRVYVEHPLQADWDDIAEKMVHAINNSRDSTRRETPFYLVHGWDAKSTLKAMTSSKRRGQKRPVNSADTVEWRREANRQREVAIRLAAAFQVREKARRAREHNEALSKKEKRSIPNTADDEYGVAEPGDESTKSLFKEGDQVWLFMERVKTGLTKKLAHRWHGPFRVKKKVEEFAYELELPDKSGYRFYPVVHVSRLKAVTELGGRPKTRLIADLEETQRFDFDEELLPEDSWEPDTTRDVEVESVEGDNAHDEFDSDDLDGPSPSIAVVATAAAGADGSSMIQRVRISAISDLKEFTGKDQDEAEREMISNFKSALKRDQASDAKSVWLCDLLAGPARNWYRQLGRSTRKRSDASPLEYLHRLYVAGLRAKLKIKDGGSKLLREHVDHFIETLGDVDLADRLTLLRLPDADELEEVLRAVDRAKHRQKKAAVGSGKYRQKDPIPRGPARRVHQVTAPDSGSESGSDGSDSDPEDYRRVCLTVPNDRTAKTGDNSRTGDTVPGDRGMYSFRDPMDGTGQLRCSQCGFRKHPESGCWKHLVCEKCGKKGHPGDHCLYVCRGCGDIYDAGKCPKETFYNQIRQ